LLLSAGHHGVLAPITVNLVRPDMLFPLTEPQKRSENIDDPLNAVEAADFRLPHWARRMKVYTRFISKEGKKTASYCLLVLASAF